jgi:hypothetical protein
MADAVKLLFLLKISCLDILWPVFVSKRILQYKEGKYLIKRLYAFSGQKALRIEKKHRSICRSTMPCGPLKQFNQFQPACRCRTVSTRASYCFPVFLPHAKQNAEHICVSQHSRNILPLFPVTSFRTKVSVSVPPFLLVRS